MTRLLIVLPAVLGACAMAGDPYGSIEQSSTAKAEVSLASSDAAFTLTSNTAWSLTKTGSVDTSAKTVKWTITATKGTTVAGQLVASGYMTVTNSGSAPATIGNVAVNLQAKAAGGWVSKSIDVADATSGDAGTSVQVDPRACTNNLSVLTENAASGPLQFMDASSNTAFSLVPEVTVAAGETKTLLFAATFDNRVLNLPVTSAVRAEVIVTFGNAGTHGPSVHDVDINGNGVIDADETSVRSIGTRIARQVPTQSTDNGSITIHDSSSNIKTTGTVTYSNAQFNIGATSGTVTVSYDGGTSGGKITNCATATGGGTTVTVGGFPFPIVSGANLSACDTEDIGADTCTPGAPNCGWADGQMLTYAQGAWSSTGPASSVLNSHYNAVYFATGDLFDIGDSSKYVAQFDSASAVEAFMPQAGTAGVFTGSLADPTTSSAGVFGGDVAALKLNVDFNDAGYVTGTASVKLGDLLLCNVTPATLNGVTVRQFLATANSVIGASSTTYTAVELDTLANRIDASFAGGAASTFAQSSLVNATMCP
jgi:hypothetical protein